MAEFLLSGGAPDRRAATSEAPPSSYKKRATRSPRKWAPNMLPQVKTECGHWCEAWPEIKAFPCGFIKVYCDIDGDWSRVVDTSKIPDLDENDNPLF